MCRARPGAADGVRRAAALQLGGQQQRVALARALVFDPALLLLDEPLSALDKKLRAGLQEELKALHRCRIGCTFINVTHDQEEALSLSDRIAILNHAGGWCSRARRPSPRVRGAAHALRRGFLGRPLHRRHGGRAGAVSGRGAGVARGGAAARGPVLLALRPEKIRLLAEGEEAANSVAGRIAKLVLPGGGLHPGGGDGRAGRLAGAAARLERAPGPGRGPARAPGLGCRRGRAGGG